MNIKLKTLISIILIFVIFVGVNLFLNQGVYASQVEIKDYKYMITRLKQGEATVINILLKDKGKIYILDKLLSCDTTDKAENIKKTADYADYTDFFLRNL